MIGWYYISIGWAKGILLKTICNTTWDNLLCAMAKSKKQNANESSIHIVIRLHCPKTVFVGVCRVHGVVVSAIVKFDEGTTHISKLWRSML